MLVKCEMCWSNNTGLEINFVPSSALQIKMYRALYSFQATDPSALSFTASAHFTVMDTSDQYWWLVQNGSGFVGYVPANYLAKEEVSGKASARLNS